MLTNLSKSNQFSTRHISETKSVTPDFYFVSETSKSLSLHSRRLKKIYRVENFRANILKEGNWRTNTHPTGAADVST